MHLQDHFCPLLRNILAPDNLGHVPEPSSQAEAANSKTAPAPAASSLSPSTVQVERTNDPEHGLSRTSNSMRSSISNSSTDRYSQETFQTFQDKVLSLALNTVWDDVTVDDKISVERMRGGAYNRVVGLTRRTKGKPDIVVQYIVRIPRYQDSRVGDDVAALRFALEQSLPAPGVVAFDETRENQLELPYMIQSRVPGTPLQRCIEHLSHPDRCRVATELGAIVRQMLDIRSSMSGKLVLPPTERGLFAPIHVNPWYARNSTESKPFSSSAASSSVKEMLTSALLAWKSEELSLRPDTRSKPDIIDQFITMTQQMSHTECLLDGSFTLAHLDLAPRNIMVNVTSDTNKNIISGVLDWDSAVLGPMFTACVPPSWVWAEWDSEDGEEETDSEELASDYLPSTENGLELKRLFDEAAGPQYRSFAYNQIYSLPKRLMRFVIEGMKTSEHVDEAEALIYKWEKIWEAKEARGNSEGWELVDLEYDHRMSDNHNIGGL